MKRRKYLWSNLIIICVITIVFWCAKNVSETIIDKNEYEREQQDVQLLNEIKNVFSDALVDESVREYILKLIGSRDNCRFRVSNCIRIIFDDLEEKYKILYENINKTDISKKIFLSQTFRKEKANGRVYVYIDKNFDVDVIAYDNNGQIINLKY